MCLPLFCLKCMIQILFLPSITLWRETAKCGKYKVPPTYLYLYSIWSAWNNGGQSHAIVSLRCSIFSKLHLRHTVQPYTTIMNRKTTRQRYNTFWQHKLFNWIILFIPEIIHKSTDHAAMMLSLFTGSTWKEQEQVKVFMQTYFFYKWTFYPIWIPYAYAKVILNMVWISSGVIQKHHWFLRDTFFCPDLW